MRSSCFRCFTRHHRSEEHTSELQSLPTRRSSDLSLLGAFRCRCTITEEDRQAKRGARTHAQLLFSLLHSPPSSHEINRTSWRMDDLHRIMSESGHRMSKKRIRTFIKTAEFKWRKAKVVLTSNDPDYQTKVDVIKRTPFEPCHVP